MEYSWSQLHVLGDKNITLFLEHRCLSHENLCLSSPLSQNSPYAQVKYVGVVYLLSFKGNAKTKTENTHKNNNKKNLKSNKENNNKTFPTWQDIAPHR